MNGNSADGTDPDITGIAVVPKDGQNLHVLCGFGCNNDHIRLLGARMTRKGNTLTYESGVKIFLASWGVAEYADSRRINGIIGIMKK